MISRADMASRGVPRTTVDAWYRDRARTGHPWKAWRVGRTDYWYEDEWTAWYEGHRRGKVESLTQVDRSGDPDDLVDANEAARMLHYANRLCNSRQPSPERLPRARRLREGRLRRPDAATLHRSWAAADRRQGMGGGRKPGAPSTPAKPHPYAGDERLTRVLAELRACIQPSSAGNSPPNGMSASAPPNGSSARRGPFSAPDYPVQPLADGDGLMSATKKVVDL